MAVGGEFGDNGRVLPVGTALIFLLNRRAFSWRHRLVAMRELRVRGGLNVIGGASDFAPYAQTGG